MLAIPAIDIREGRCVRLLRGDFGAETVYGDPVQQALTFVAAGAPMLHLVDLDAARTGRTTNDPLIRAITDAVDVPVQVGGGIRGRERAEELLSAGAARVIIGTLAIEDPGAACQLASAFPGRIVVGFDHRRDADDPGRRVVATHGWEQSGGVDLLLALGRLDEAPFAATVITDISRDGTLEGADVEGYRDLLGRTAVPIIASGGISGADDLRALARLDTGGRGLFGAVIGRALLSGALSVAEAVAACAP